MRDESGDVVQARQESTQREKVNAFFQQLTREQLKTHDSFEAVLEVCGLNDWLIRLLYDYRCHKVLLIQPHDRNRRKNDMRNAVIVNIWIFMRAAVPPKPERVPQS